MLSKANVIKIFFSFLALALFIVPKLSYADWSVGIGVGDRHDDRRDHRDDHRVDHRFYRYHDHPHYGLHIGFLPDGYFTIWAGGARYYYSDGLYYSYVGYGDYEPGPQSVVSASHDIRSHRSLSGEEKVGGEGSERE